MTETSDYDSTRLREVQLEYRELTATYDTVFSVIYYTAGVIALPTNLLLLFLILRISPPSLRVYRVLLLNSCVTDLFYTISITLVQPRIIPNKWAFAYVANGPAKYWGSNISYQIYCMQLHSIFYTFLSFPLSFGFRYFVLIRPVPRIRSVVLICLSLWSIAIFQHASFHFSQWDPQNVVDYMKETKPYYDMTGYVVSGNHMLDPPLTTFVLGTIVLPMFPIYVIIGYFYKKVDNFLKRNNQNLHERTIRGQKRLLKALTIQAALPVFTVFPPISIYALYHIELINVTIIEYLVYSLFCFFPVFSPMITIYFVKPYHTFVCQSVGFVAKRISSVVEPTTYGEGSVPGRNTNTETQNSTDRKNKLNEQIFAVRVE